MWKFGTLALLVALVALAVWGQVACGPSGSAGQQCMDQNDAAENGNMALATEGSGCGSLTGTVAPGSPCEAGAECQPACCSCESLSTQSQSVEVAYCHAGVCAEANDTCCTFLTKQRETDAGDKTCM